MASSTTDRLIRIMLDVAENSRSAKTKMRVVELIRDLRQSRPRKGKKPAPKPLTDTERLLGVVQKTDSSDVLGQD